ncbi:chaperone protein DnaJ 49, partial [Tanacetum coccineum]
KSGFTIGGKIPKIGPLVEAGQDIYLSLDKIARYCQMMECLGHQNPGSMKEPVYVVQSEMIDGRQGTCQNREHTKMWETRESGDKIDPGKPPPSEPVNSQQLAHWTSFASSLKTIDSDANAATISPARSNLDLQSFLLGNSILDRNAEPAYYLMEAYDVYHLPMYTKEYQIKFYVRSLDAFNQKYPLGTPARAAIEDEISTKYVEKVQDDCRYELECFSEKKISRGWYASSATTPDSPAFLKDRHQKDGIHQVLQRPDFPAFLNDS